MNTPKTAHILRHAKQLIANPKQWIQNDFARTRDRKTLITLDRESAKCFCMAGAVIRAHIEATHESYADLDWRKLPELDPLVQCLAEAEPRFKITSSPADIIPAINDNPRTTHADVMRYFDCAIARAETEEAS